MTTWVLIFAMKYALHTGSINQSVIEGFSSQESCELAGKKLSKEDDYHDHICLEVKK